MSKQLKATADIYRYEVSVKKCVYFAFHDVVASVLSKSFRFTSELKNVLLSAFPILQQKVKTQVEWLKTILWSVSVLLAER